MKRVTIDGNFAASNIAYMFNDVAVVYPITPSSPMAENCDQFVFDGKKNIFGNELVISQMQSEAGVAGAVHGSLMAGAKTTTFTSSQGLLLMIPNMYKIAGEGLPTVFYVSARAVASHALNIFCDYSDVYACLKTGFNIVNCSSVQEVNDMAVACELASAKSNIPYICFFDGFRTSHELNTIYMTELNDLYKIVNPTYFAEFRDRALNNHDAFVMGSNQNPDVFMQNRVKALKRYNNAIEDFKWALNKQEKITNRRYDTVEYFGDEDAKNVVVAMGSCADVLSLAEAQYKKKVGVIKVRMLKPFDSKKFIEKLPKGVKNVTILERNLDVNGVDTMMSMVLSALHKNGINAKTYSGCYGLGGKEFTPDMAMSVFDNMDKGQKEFFTVGIYDDVTNTSLEVIERYQDKVSDFSMRVYGLGSDGSVSSVKNTIKILGEETTSFVQGYFDYDSKKSGSLTVSHMRSSFLPINSPFNPRVVDLVVCNNEGFVGKYDITDCLKNNGTIIINTGYSFDELNRIMPNKMKQDLKSKRAKIYLIDAKKIARDNGLGCKINTIMQMATFYVSKLLPFDVATEKVEKFIVKTYSRKGQEIVDKNLNAIKDLHDKIVEVLVDELTQNEELACALIRDEYYENIIVPTSNQDGDKISVSKFDEYGRMPTNTSKYQKRMLSEELPQWISDKCIQCGRCVEMCPHMALTPVVFDGKVKSKSLETRKAFNSTGEYRLQVNPNNCTGCGVCSTVCPVKAIMMNQDKEYRKIEEDNYHTVSKIKYETKKNIEGIKDLQFKKPYFDYSGACAGCGETPYIKMVTQLFGDRMLIANATGCSSIYGGTYPTCPYSKDDEGFGPSWANSLFEDNAEFGYGIAIARKNRRKNFLNAIKNMQFSKKMTDLLANFIKNPENHENNKQLIIDLKNYRKGHIVKDNDKYIYDNINLITSPSVWIFGGDGWAYDIGFGGLDHVVASGENVNILILDTEVYSNTGGQTSKATPRGASAKFNVKGKYTKKKDLASMLMTYGDVYVASVCMGANPDQCLKAMQEAEAYDGPSVIIAYSPCVNHGYNMRESQVHAFNSVKSGYNTLFRYNPTNDNPMTIDSFDPIMDFDEYLESENRFAIIDKMNKKEKSKLFKLSKQDANTRRNNYKDKK